jgi:hypothetical protein
VNGLEPVSSPKTQIPFVLRMGVTGHRNPADPIAVYGETQSSIEALLLFIVDQLSSPRWRQLSSPRWRSRHVRHVDTPLMVRILSPLAEGADRIAVHATFAAAGAVDVPLGPNAKSGWPSEFATSIPHGLEGYRRAKPGWASELAAVIPYDLAAYREHDCPSEGSPEEFDLLLSLSPEQKVLQAESPTRQQRELWYRQAGRYVADHCDVLLALWDGTHSQMTAGTAATVKYALEHGTPVLWIPTLRENGQLECPMGCERVERQLILRRWRGDPNSQHGHSLERGKLRKELTHYFRQVKRRSDFIERVERLEEYNRFAQRRDMSSYPWEAYSHYQILREHSDSSRADELTTKVARWFYPKREVAEKLATRYQKRFRRLDIGVYGLTVVAVTVGAMSLFFNSWVPVIAESLVLVFLLGITVLNVRRNFHDRWMGYRALTEYWRSNEFMGLVAPPSPDGEEARTPLMERVLTRSRIVPWFAPVVENVWQARPRFNIDEGDVSWLKKLLIRDWIDDQSQWHDQKSKKHDRWSERYGLAIKTVFGLSVGLVLFHAVTTLLDVGRHPKRLDSTAGGIIAIVVIALASAGAALNSLASHANHAGHADRFSDVAYDLNEQSHEVDAAKDLKSLRRSVRNVFRIMLGETSTWFQGMASSEVEIPT